MNTQATDKQKANFDDICKFIDEMNILENSFSSYFDPTDINSELLATLLASENTRKDWYEAEDQVQDFLDGLDWDEPDEDEEDEPEDEPDEDEEDEPEDEPDSPED